MSKVPRRLMKVHFTLMIAWLLLAIPSLLWWKESILWVIFISLYANVVSHAGAWSAARAERSSEENPPQENRDD